jgi:hypothetical protein
MSGSEIDDEEKEETTEGIKIEKEEEKGRGDKGRGDKGRGDKGRGDKGRNKRKNYQKKQKVWVYC